MTDAPHSSPDSAAEILAALSAVVAHLPEVPPSYMAMGAINYAMLSAHIAHQHRDRRRIKREVNKAARVARIKLRGGK